MMRKLKANCLVAFILLGISFSAVYGQTEWTKFFGNPVMDIGKEGEWDEMYLSSLEILYHENKYKMWFGGGDDFSYMDIGYAESDDGIYWTKYFNNPVLKRGDGTAWDKSTIGAPCVLIDDSNYRMYYSARNGIGLAHSVDGFSWEKHPSNPIMLANEEWGLQMITMPCILKIESLYHMWYSCYDGQGSNTFQIGYATSTDGIEWEKYEDNPVFKYGGTRAWDQGAHANTIIFSDSLYHMWYSAYSDDRGWLLGYAASLDGIHWDRYEDNPIINRLYQWEAFGIPGCTVLEQDNVFRMWYDGVSPEGNGRFGMATSPKLDHDIALLSIPVHLQNVPILVKNYVPIVNIINFGSESETAVEIECKIQNEEGIVYEKRLLWDKLNPAGLQLYSPELQPVSLLQEGVYDLTFSSNLLGDEYKANDSLKTTLNVTNTLDDFEKGIHLWDVDSKWAISDEQSKSGEFSVKSGGDGKYENNVDASAVYRYAFDLSQQEAAYLQFHTRHFIQANSDFGYVEVSADSGITWQQLANSYTGIKAGWYEQKLALDDFCGEGFENVQIRFRFVSDASGRLAGWFIDDVEIYIGEIETKVESNTNAIPQDFVLFQNYPNPFNPETEINYAIPQGSHVKIEIFNMLGQRVKTLVNSYQMPGKYCVMWNGKNDKNEQMGSGVYLCKMQTRDISRTIKLMMVK